ncbi:MAG: ABC transporter ATP-binding protein [Ignavibacteriaceae bacterium]
MNHLYSLKKYFLKYKSRLLLGILFLFLSSIGYVYIPVAIKDAINELQSRMSYDAILKYSLLIVGSSLFSGIFRFYIRQTIIVVSREIEYDLRRDFWGHIQRLPLRYFQNTSTGNIMAHATNDINAVRMFIGPAVMYSIDTIIRFVMVIAIMASISVEVTLYSLLPLPLLSVLVYKVGKKIHERFTAIQEKFSELTTKAQENFSGIRVIKSYLREDFEIESFREMSRQYLQKNMRLVKIQALFQPILFLITGVSVIIVVWTGGMKVISGDLLLGDITAIIIYLGMLTWPMIAVGWVINIIQQAEASMKRLSRILAEPYEIEDSRETNFAISELKGDIEFRNVSFSYGKHLAPVLKNINLKIPKGTTLAIMGGTGSGKSSFINLIPRLYDVTEGDILIDEIPLKEIPVSVLRKNIGIVQQESFLFSDTIENNLAYGLETFDESVVRRASEIAHFDRDVREFPAGYKTILGERGITLSGGQKQRASLARALVINPTILILDDSFSAVDTHTEEEILRNLKEFMKERTSIIISHRISTVKDADKIIFIDNGRIVEEGTHNELLALNGQYAGIHFKQMLEKELEEIS